MRMSCGAEKIMVTEIDKITTALQLEDHLADQIAPRSALETVSIGIICLSFFAIPTPPTRQGVQLGPTTRWPREKCPPSIEWPAASGTRTNDSNYVTKLSSILHIMFSFEDPLEILVESPAYCSSWHECHDSRGHTSRESSQPSLSVHKNDGIHHAVDLSAMN